MWCDLHAVAATPHYRWTTSLSSNVSPQVGTGALICELREGGDSWCGFESSQY